MSKQDSEQILMRIFIGENDRFQSQPLYEALLELFRDEGLAGATVLRGVSGFGASSEIHTDKLLRLSNNLPLVIEVIDSEPNIDAVLPKIDGMFDGGLITLEKARVIRYRSGEC